MVYLARNECLNTYSIDTCADRHRLSVLGQYWLGHLTVKARPRYDLYCVWWDVKPCSINQSNQQTHVQTHAHTLPHYMSSVGGVLISLHTHGQHLTNGLCNILTVIHVKYKVTINFCDVNYRNYYLTLSL